MKTGTESNNQMIPAQQMSRIGAELLMKAAACAAMMALIAGMLAALIGS